MKKGLIYLIFILVLSINSLGIGITPGKYTIDFQPNYNEIVAYKILNNDNKDMEVLLNLEGEFSSYVTLHNKLVSFKPGEESKEFTYEVKLPNKIDKPGTHEIKLTALDLPKNYNQNGNFIGATTAVISLIHIRVPYPGKYLEGKLDIEEKGGKVRFLMPVTNLGKENIYLAKAVVDVYGPTNEKIVSLNSDQKGINSFEKRELVAEINSKDLSPGKYYAVTNINYDGQILKLESIFEAGLQILDILEISVRDFKPCEYPRETP